MDIYTYSDIVKRYFSLMHTAHLYIIIRSSHNVWLLLRYKKAAVRIWTRNITRSLLTVYNFKVNRVKRKDKNKLSL